MNTVYLISGPLGVGKTTVTRALHKALGNSVLVEGDIFLHALGGGDELVWEKKLELSWQEILTHAKEGLQKDHDVVIDFVVEEELLWFYKEISSLGAALKYVILTTTREQIIERLKKRDELQYLDRSLFLLDKLTTSPGNAQYLYDTTDKQEISGIVSDIMNTSRFIIINQHGML